MTDVSLLNLAQAFRPLDQLTERVVGSAATEALKQDGLVLLGAVREELSRPGTGRTYKLAVVRRDGTLSKTKRGRTRYRIHRASAPGFPPAVMYGELRRGAVMGMVQTRMRVGVTARYGPWLQFGTPRMRPRPFMDRALARVQAQLITSAVLTMRGKGVPRGL